MPENKINQNQVDYKILNKINELLFFIFVAVCL